MVRVFTSLQRLKGYCLDVLSFSLCLLDETAEDLCWLLGTSVHKVDGFALVFLICLAALVIHR